MSKTLGQKRIGDFNPSGEGVIDGIKQRAIELFDYINDNVTADLNPDEASEILSLKTLALRLVEDAAMKGVKSYIHYKK
jgi:hypothetical protein